MGNVPRPLRAPSLPPNVQLDLSSLALDTQTVCSTFVCTLLGRARTRMAMCAQISTAYCRVARNSCSKTQSLSYLVYEITVQSEFAAAHAIAIRGSREKNHGHNWRVTVDIQGDSLDDDGLLCDFHLIESELSAIIEPFRNADLNTTQPFDRTNPTAENVAVYIASTLQHRLAHVLPRGACVSRVSITEAPGCTASFRPAPLSR